MPKRKQYVEVKSGNIYGPMAKKIARKGTVASVVAGGHISGPAKEVFDRAGITYAEDMEIERKERERRR